MHESTEKSVRGAASELRERGNQEKSFYAREIKSRGIDWDYMIDSAHRGDLFMHVEETSYRLPDNSRNCLINTPSRMSVNAETSPNIDIVII